MNYKIPVALFFLVASVSAVMYVQLEEDAVRSENVIEVENNMSDEELRLYEDEEKVGYVASWSNGPNGRQENYKNMSLDRWTTMKTNYIAEEEIIEELEAEFGNNSARRIHTSIEQGEGYHFGINVTYDRHFNYPFSYDEFEETVPDQVEGTLHYRGQTNTATLPVFTSAVGTERDYNYTVENFSSNYELRDGSGAILHIEENYSSVDPDTDVLDLQVGDHSALISRLTVALASPESLEEPGQIMISSSEEETIEDLKNSEYIKHRGTYYNITYELPEKPPQNEIVFDSKLFSNNVTPNSPAKIQLKLEINTDGNTSLSTGAPPPFGVLHAESDDERICLGSPAYEESDHVADNLCTEGGFANDIGLNKEHQPGEVIKRNYTASYQSIREPGNYTIDESISYRDENERILEYEIGFSMVPTS